jgi:hypothetical protein
MKEFVIDLDLDPYDRFKEVATFYKDDILTLYGVNMFNASKDVVNIFEYGYSAFEEQFPIKYREMEGIAEVLEVPVWIVIYHNFFFAT